MITAIPIDAKGVAIGAEQSFSDKQWDKMVSIFGKNLRFRKVKQGSSKSKELELMPKKAVSTKEAKAKNIEAKEEKAIRKAYHDKFGRWPGKHWKLETIKKKTNE